VFLLLKTNAKYKDIPFFMFSFFFKKKERKKEKKKDFDKIVDSTSS
jgi:hypothetical protein